MVNASGVGHVVVDGMPLIGKPRNHDNVFYAAMNSGILLALMIARMMTERVLDGVDSPLLKPYSADQFDEPASRDNAQSRLISRRS